jgi:hypothetical protein
MLLLLLQLLLLLLLHHCIRKVTLMQQLVKQSVKLARSKLRRCSSCRRAWGCCWQRHR